MRATVMGLVGFGIGMAVAVAVATAMGHELPGLAALAQGFGWPIGNTPLAAVLGPSF